MFSKIILAIAIIIFCSYAAIAQPQMAAADSLLTEFNTEKDITRKVSLAGRLSILYMSMDPAKADSFGRKAIELGELSRNRNSMIKAYLYNGDRYSYMVGIKENIPIAISHYQKAYQLARESKFEKEMVASLLGLSTVHRSIPDAEKAMNYTAQAFSIISDRSMDSLEARCYLSFGNDYMLKKEKLLALKNFFNAQRIAELLKDKKLQRDAFLELSEFYYSIENFDKAIDYAVRASDMLSDAYGPDGRYMKVNDLNYIGSLFVQKKQYDLARKSFDHAISLADSLKYDPLKLTAYLNIFNMYLLSNQPAQALTFFNNTPELKSYIIRTGYSSVIDHAYGYIYTDMDKLDSAGYYYKKAYPFFAKQFSNLSKVNFFNHYAKYQFKAKNYDGAISLLNEAATTAKQMNDLDWQQVVYHQLDSAYQLKGDYKSALHFASLSQHLKDTLQQLGKEEDILQLQIADEDDRRTRLAKEEEESKKRRHQYQYLAITIGIASLFITLVMLGMFKVSAATIRIVGFFTFLMLFEFIFLVLKKNIYFLTEGEPWKDLAFMIALAAVLLPLHHWVEHKVIHYLTTKRLIRIDHGKYLRRLFKKKNAMEQL